MVKENLMANAITNHTLQSHVDAKKKSHVVQTLQYSGHVRLVSDICSNLQLS